MKSVNNDDVISSLLKADFIKYLIKKLKTGNLRGSHLNCIPGKSRNRFSLFELEKTLQDEGVNLRKLLTEERSISLRINIPPIEEEAYEKKLSNPKFIKSKNYEDFIKERVILVRRLNNISYDLKNELQEYGTKSFGFGFPSIAIKDPTKPDKVLIAPLLIWYLDLKQDNLKSNSWILSKSEDSPIVLNEVLFNYLKESHSVSFEDFKDVQERILEDGLIDAQELTELVYLFEKKLNQGKEVSAKNYIELECEDFSTKDSLIEQLDKDRLRVISNGSFAFYRTFKESIIQDMENLLKNLNSLEAEVATSYQSDFFSAIPTDPSQSKLLESLGSEKNILVQGPPGTGKSQSLTAILTNALRNHAKCLVVCEKKTAIEILYSNLEKLGLESLAIMIDDPIKDRNKIVEAVREKIENVQPIYNSYSFESAFETEMQIYKTARSRLENHHKVKNTKQLENDTRQHLIGKLLKSTTLKDSLSAIDVNIFNFNSDEYRELKSSLSQFEVLSNFLIKQDPLSLLTSKYIDGEYSETRKLLLENINSLKEIIEFIERNAESIIEQYRKRVIDQSDELAIKLKSLIENILTHYKAISDNAKTRLEYDDLNVSLSTKILANINFLNREILLFKKNTLDSISKINNLLRNEKLFEGIKIENFEKQNIKTLLSKLGEIDKFCNKANILKLVDNHIQDFNLGKGLLIEDKELSDLARKTKDYKILIDAGYVDTNVFNIPVDTSLLALIEISKGKLDLLEALQNRFDYLHEYYTVMKFINEQEQNTQLLLKKMLDFPKSEWGEIFDEWFINNFLSKNKTADILQNDYDIRKIIKAHKAIRVLYPKLIKNYWNGEAARVVSSYLRKSVALKSLYNLRGANGKRRNSLRTILSYDFDSFTNFFPIVLTNPSTVSSVIPLKLGVFDVVIFDEASQLRIEDTLASFIRGKIHIVSGDKYQMPPSSFFISDVDVADESDDLKNPESNEELQKTLEKNHLLNLITSESLLDFADQLHFTQAYLDIHYRSRHPDLIEFSNKAFYGSRLIPTPPLVSEKSAINYHEVKGLYQSEDQTNQKECDEVIKIIQEEYNDDPKLTIGVATLNLNQRNLILDKLAEASAKNEKFALMMNDLDSNGFFVKNLENIQGDERDIIIIATTFGRKEDNSFLQNFGPLTRKGGYRLLNVIITRAKERLHLVTSIPEDYYSQYEKLLNQEGNDGKAIFYAYLVYAKAVSQNDIAQKENVLKKVAGNIDWGNIDKESLDLTESPFEEEVYQRMTRFMPAEKIHLQQKVGGFRLDIVVDTTDPTNKIAIECDGATYHRSEEDHFWDIFRQEYLENFGYTFYRIWSENWFEDQASETRKLIAFIEANNGVIKRS